VIENGRRVAPAADLALSKIEEVVARALHDRLYG